MMNLVAGEAAVVESPGDHFAPFEVHYAETFVVPADVGEFTVRGRGQGPWSTIKASVRGTQVAHG